MPEKLDYATRETINGGVTIRPAMIFAVIPLAIGLLALSIWAATRSMLGPILGLLNIPFGLICVGAAITTARRYARIHRGLGMMPPSRINLWFGLAVLTAILNFPACIACFQTACWLSNRYTLTVHNDGTASITNCTLGTTNGSLALGPIPPGGRISHSWTVGREGSVTCQAVISGQTVSADVDGYVGSGEGPKWKTVRFNGTAPPMVK